MREQLVEGAKLKVIDENFRNHIHVKLGREVGEDKREVAFCLECSF